MLGGLILGDAARADLLWYDGFEVGAEPGQYTLGTIAGQSGGAGTFFTGAWIQPGGDDTNVLADSLAVPMQMPPSTGGALGEADVAECCITGRVGRLFAEPWSGRNAPEGTFYMGFLANFGASLTGGEAHHRVLEMWEGGFEDGPNRNLMLGYSTFAGVGSDLALWVKDSTSATNVVKPLSENIAFASDGRSHSFVMKFELSNTDGADMVSVFLDPENTTEPASPSVTIAGADFAGGGLDLLLDRMGGIVQFSFTGAETGGKMDELRVGTTFADVVITTIPEPTALTLFGLAALGMARVIRRK
jgi:hypothetical protein